jgi:putative transposase
MAIGASKSSRRAVDMPSALIGPTNSGGCTNCKCGEGGSDAVWRLLAHGRCRRWPWVRYGPILFDACANGQQLKCLTVVDEFARECLAIDVTGSIRSGRVIEVPTKVLSVHGSSKYRPSDNGPEFVSRAVLKWPTQSHIDTAHIDPGKPWQNGSNDSFNGKFDECLSMEWFRNGIDAKIVIEQYRRHYNEVRRHSSLGQLTPNEFKQQLSVTTNPSEWWPADSFTLSSL